MPVSEYAKREMNSTNIQQVLDRVLVFRQYIHIYFCRAVTMKANNIKDIIIL